MENKVAVVTEKLSEAINNPLECWIMEISVFLWLILLDMRFIKISCY